MKAFAALLLLLPCFAQDKAPAPRGYAFILANGQYAHLPPLNAALADGRRIAATLEKAGFAVTRVENAQMPALFTRDRESFLQKLNTGDVVFIYYSGYSVQGDDEVNYLLPVNFDPAGDLRQQAFSLNRFLTDLADKNVGPKLIMVEGPPRLEQPIRGEGGQGLIQPDFSRLGELVFALSVQPGQWAPAGDASGALFTKAVVTELEKPGLLPREVFEHARDDVTNQTNLRQNPYVNPLMRSTFYFHEPVTPTDVPTVVTITKVDTVPTNPHDREEYVYIPPGKFKMGCVPKDTRCQAAEKPQHEVTISKGFYLGRTELEVGAYQRFVDAKKLKMPASPPDWNKWRSPSLPMVMVQWDQARDFCAWTGGRLPTEAEWEYAARGGASEEIYPLNNENSRDKANFYGKSGNDRYDGVAPVRSFDANPFNLFDMAGNVWEWVADWYDPSYYSHSPAVDPPGPAMGKEHVIRGGSFESDPKEHLRLSYRQAQGGPQFKVGFRCALDDTPETKKLLNVK